MFVITQWNGDGRLSGDPAVCEFLALVGGFSDAARLSERDYVDFALAFASLKLPEAADHAHSVYLQLMSGLRTTEPLPDLLPIAVDTAAALQEAQERFVECLEAIRQDPAHAATQVASALFDAGSRIVMRPTFLTADGAVEVSYRCFPADFDAALGFALMLLIECNRPFLGNLCRCKYLGCQRYFLAVTDKTRVGRPRRDYCSGEHFRLARASTAKDRIRAYRKGLRDKRQRTARRKPK